MKNNKNLLNDYDLKNVLGGLNESELIFELSLIADKYSKVQQILEAYESGDFGTYTIMLANLEYDHPELGYLFK